MRYRHLLVTALMIFALGTFSAFATPIEPNVHGWGSYHWGRSCGTCAASITVYNSLVTTNTNWSDHLNKSIFGDPANPNTLNRRGWNDSSVLTLTIAAGSTSTTTRSSCPSVSNAVRVCNYNYGSNGWLGLASINTTTAGGSHIAWGTSKMNDTYFASGYPNTEKRHVMCQEVGHDFGLGHTSENGTSQNTCMDYYQNTSSTDWQSTGPNQHDFDRLLTQHHYGKFAAPPANYDFLSFTGKLPGDGNDPWSWGTPVEFDNQGRGVIYRLDFGDDHGTATWTHVYWADPHDDLTRTPGTEKLDQ